MNLHGIVSSAVGAINPPISVTLSLSAGYTTAPDGTREPAYAQVSGVQAQVQALSFTDLQKLGSLNLTGIRRKLYLNGNIEGIDRQAVKGGDLVQMGALPGFPNVTTWLVVQQLEWWQDWCSIAVTLQNGS
jgi:hypothetical protein